MASGESKSGHQDWRQAPFKHDASLHLAGQYFILILGRLLQTSIEELTTVSLWLVCYHRGLRLVTLDKRAKVEGKLLLTLGAYQVQVYRQTWVNVTLALLGPRTQQAFRGCLTTVCWDSIL